MPTNLTGQTIASTYDQLLHVSDGPTATEKTVYSGTGVATALKVGTLSASVDNIKLDGNTISTLNTNGNLVLSPNGTGSVTIAKADITGGSVAGITDLAIADGGTGASTAVGARTNLGLGTAAVLNLAYAAFYDAGTTDQTGSITDKTAVKWATAAVAGTGVTVASNSRITLAAAGTYRFNVNIQLNNADSNDHDATFWFAKNGTNIASSASKITVPKAADGGTLIFAIEIFETVAASDYIEMYWFPEDADVTLRYIAPVAANPGVTPAIPAVPPAIVVVQRIA